MAAQPTRVTKGNVHEVLDNIDTIFLDCDGVIWGLTGPIAHASEGLQKLRDAGKKLFFVTNNSLRTASELIQRFKGVGFVVEEDDVVFPVMAFAQHLKRKGFNKKLLYYGTEVARNLLVEAGINATSPQIDPVDESVAALHRRCTEVDPDVAAIAMDLDFNLTVGSLMQAVNFLRNNEACEFYAGATDKAVAIGEDFLITGPGFFVELTESCTGRKAQVYGKPSHMMITSYLQEKHHINLERSLFIGDSMIQDMSMAHSIGVKKLLVLSGVTRDGDWEGQPPENVPDYVMDSVADFAKLID